jgi:hypothetical protein
LCKYLYEIHLLSPLGVPGHARLIDHALQSCVSTFGRMSHKSIEVETLTPIQPGVEQPKIDERLEQPTASANGTSSNKTLEESESADPPPRKLPFAAPMPSSEVLKRVELTADQQSKYDLVLEYMKSITSLPTSASKKNKETAPLADIEQCFLTKECILRYLRATKWNVNEAKKRLEGTIVWRREYGTDTLTSETIEPEVISPLQSDLQ